MVFNKVHLFFEQSGIFKKAFNSLGYCAFDYDIRNDFNCTDYQCDLFNAINCAYNDRPSIFDIINENDLIIAFFPCTRFVNMFNMHLQGNSLHIIHKDNLYKLENNLKLHEELSYFYSLITKLCIICYKRNLRLIIENPYRTDHYLYRYWCIRPTIIDTDRRLRGDYFEKPTQYFFINCKPSNNFVYEGVDLKKTKFICRCDRVSRSLISYDYALRFIKEFIL